MYRCTDCLQEFTIEPQYCDCGNNSFEQILSEKQEIIKPKVSVQKKKNVDKKQNELLPYFLFLLACIILSLLVFLFFGNNWIKNNDKIAKNGESASERTLDIPDIDTFWNGTYNSSPVAPVKTQVKQNVVYKNQSTIKKPSVAPRKTVSTKPVANKPITKKQSVNPKPQSVQPPVVTAAPVVTTAPVVSLLSYKTSLRNKLASSINFLSIIGDGTCSIGFSVDSSGKLINRNFISQSDNISLNNAVYQAIMANPLYNPPPDSYKGTLLKFNVTIKGGAYEITLN